MLVDGEINYLFHASMKRHSSIGSLVDTSVVKFNAQIVVIAATRMTHFWTCRWKLVRNRPQVLPVLSANSQEKNSWTLKIDGSALDARSMFVLKSSLLCSVHLSRYASSSRDSRLAVALVTFVVVGVSGTTLEKE